MSLLSLSNSGTFMNNQIPGILQILCLICASHTLIQKYELGNNWDNSTPIGLGNWAGGTDPFSGINLGDWTHSVQIPSFDPYNPESYNDWARSVQIPSFDPDNPESYNDWARSVQIPSFDPYSPESYND